MDETTPENPVLDGPESTDIDMLDWLGVQFQSLILTLWDVLSDFLLFILDMFMSLGLVVLNGFASVFELADITQYINGMPPEVHTVFANTGLGTAIGMVMTAGAARILMQLIPFVRLGS